MKFKITSSTLLICLIFMSAFFSASGQTVSPAVDLNSSSDFSVSQHDGSVAPFDTDCDTAPGLVITDDGSVENGYAGNPSTVSQVSIVEEFTITSTSLLQQVCLAFITQGPTSLNFEVVVYDNDGTGGTPGSLLGSLNATATGMATGSGAPVWQTVDLSSLNLTVSGTIFIGARWNPSSPNVFLSADESGTTPLVTSYAFLNAGPATEWGPTQDSWPAYRSMFIRPQFEEVQTASVPITSWSLLVGIGLILAFAVVRFRRLI